MLRRESVPGMLIYGDLASKEGNQLIGNQEDLSKLIPSKLTKWDNWSQISSKKPRMPKRPEIAVLNGKVLHELLDKLEQDIASCNKKLEDLTEAFNERSVIKQAILFDIDASLTVLQPIPIIIEENDNEVIASFPEIELFTVAENEPTAINNLKVSIKDLFVELADTPDNELGKIPLVWKRVLNKVLKK